MYIGNIKTKTKLIQWLKEYYSSKTNKTPTYAVLHGPPGNGKTFLVEYLAQTMQLNIHKVTPEDNYQHFLQTINVCKLDDLNTKKIILIDDVLSFNNKNIYNIEISIYPIIYTSLKYPPEELRHGLTLPITKPTSTSLFELLKEKQKTMHISHPDHVLLAIAEQSPSVRSAINSLYTGIVQKTTYPLTNIPDIRRALTNRSLQQDIDIPLLHSLIKNANFYTNLKVLETFASYDVQLKVKYKKSIDNFLVNNMPAPIESLRWISKIKKTKREESKNQNIPKPIPTYKPIKEWLK